MQIMQIMLIYIKKITFTKKQKSLQILVLDLISISTKHLKKEVWKSSDILFEIKLCKEMTV